MGLKKNQRDPRLEGLYGKARVKERKRLEYLANKEAIRARNSVWQKVNRESSRERWKKYYYGSSELLKASRLKARDKSKLYVAGWFQKNKEYKTQKNLEWQMRNPERHKELMAASKRRRTYRKRGAGGNHTTKEWEELKAIYNYTCPRCSRSEPEIKLTEDHKIPISKGGNNNIDNIQPPCHSCNSSKGTKTWFASYPINSHVNANNLYLQTTI